MKVYSKCLVITCALLFSVPALAAIKVEVEYQSTSSMGHTSVILNNPGDSVELFGSDRSQLNLKLVKLEGTSAGFVADMLEPGAKEPKPLQARVVTLLGETAEIKSNDDQGKLIYRLRLKPVKFERGTVTR